MKSLIIEENGKIFVCGSGRKKGIMSGDISEIDIEMRTNGHRLTVYGSGRLEGLTRSEIQELEVLRKTPVKVLIKLAQQWHAVTSAEKGKTLDTAQKKELPHGS